MGLFGILLALVLLIGLAYRGWTVLLLAPAAAMLAAALSGEPVLAHWTQTFMQNAARFVAQFFPLFLLGALFGVPYKGSVVSIIFQMSGGVRASMGYCGCATIDDMKNKAEFVEITAAGIRESHVHDVQITKEAPNYRAD